ncbi:tRNA methyltransferase [Candidatus Marsarchaeota archaeon]|jgi:tRNA (cytidine56-2'-O)-methyltransferase|nr:tRNA methyltransferase [Candidatus Marsarchaeota archaeon]MCL5100192.1 tRNA methyltransferase [Candidatus Marsarchaeota archaeon]
MGKVYVLRIGHRPERDKRVTTHVGLVARAFGANGFVLEGDDSHVLAAVRGVLERWGGRGFALESAKDGKAYVRRWKRAGGAVAHLTMYGINIKDAPKMPPRKPLLVVVGAEKVEPWYYRNATYNIAIGNQPHSEVAALAIFLDRLGKGKELARSFPGAHMKIIPQKSGKKVVRI